MPLLEFTVSTDDDHDAQPLVGAPLDAAEQAVDACSSSGCHQLAGARCWQLSMQLHSLEGELAQVEQIRSMLKQTSPRRKLREAVAAQRHHADSDGSWGRDRIDFWLFADVLTGDQKIRSLDGFQEALLVYSCQAPGGSFVSSRRLRFRRRWQAALVLSGADHSLDAQREGGRDALRTIGEVALQIGVAEPHL